MGETPAKASVMKSNTKIEQRLRTTSNKWHTLGAGALFCSLPIFELAGCPEVFDVYASTSCQVYSIKGKDLLQLTRESPNIRSAIEQHMTKHLRHLLWQSPAISSCYSLPYCNSNEFAPPGYILEDVQDDDRLL